MQANARMAEMQAAAETSAARIKSLEASKAAETAAAQAPPTTHKGKRGFLVTPQHEAIFAGLVDGSPGLGVMAVAGSGKTSTLVEGSGRMLDALSPAKFAFVAFNRANAETLRSRLPIKVSSSTIHSLCWKAIRTSRQWTGQEGERIKPGRLRQATEASSRRHASGEEQMRLEKELQVLWGLCVSTMTRMDDIEAITAMAQDYGAEVEPESTAFALLPEVDGMLRSQPDTISYDEMLRIVVEEQLPVEQADYVLVDEVQDLNRLQMEVVALMRPRKVVMVGDPNQAIYAWRGSDHRAVDTMARRFGVTQRLPLSITYRCAKSIVKEARRIVREIQPLPDAPDGIVVEHPADRFAETLAEMKAGELIVCRSNAPLYAAALYGHHRGLWKRICILGGDNGAVSGGLELAQRRYKTTDATGLAQAILLDIEQKTAELAEKGAGAVADASRDRNLVLALLLLMSGSVQKANEWVQSLASTTLRPDAVNLATIHRAKGFEADRVTFLGHNLVPNRMVLASSNSALVSQEWNLYYVAVTRAALVLTKQALDRENLSRCLFELLGKVKSK